MVLKSNFQYPVFSYLNIFYLLLVVQTAVAQEISFGELEHNFGSVQQGDKLTYDFPVVNKGTQDLVIRKISASCGCTAAVAESAILKPGDQTKIITSFDTTGFVGDKLKTLRVYSNDPSNSSQVLLIRANVIPELNTDPDHVDLNEILVGKGATTELSLRRYAGSPVNIKEVFSKTEFVSAEYNKLLDKIKITIDSKAPIGKYRSRFTIKSDSKSSPVINIPINFEIVGNLKIEPDTLNFGRILKSKGSVSQSFKVFSRLQGRDFELESIKTDNKRISIREFPKDESGAILVQVELTPESKEIVRGAVVIKEVGDDNEYKVSFFGYVDED